MKMKLNNEIILIGILALIGTFLAGGWIEEKYYGNNAHGIYVELPPPNPQTINMPETKIERQTETGDEIPVENIVFQPKPIAPKEFDEHILIPMELPENKGVNLPPVPSFQPPPPLFQPKPIAPKKKEVKIPTIPSPAPPPPLYELFFEKAKEDKRIQEMINGRVYKVTGMQLIEERKDAVLEVDVEGMKHEVVFDLTTETVESVR